MMLMFYVYHQEPYIATTSSYILLYVQYDLRQCSGSCAHSFHSIYLLQVVLAAGTKSTVAEDTTIMQGFIRWRIEHGMKPLY